MNDQIKELQQQAMDKGMVLVDSNATEALFTDCQAAVTQADALCEVINPENKPFESKYKARDLLDEIVKRFEATKAIATLEGNKDLIARIRPAQAALQTKIGTICWDCEEPHNAQMELERACTFYFPGLIEKIEGLAGEGVDMSLWADAKGLVDFEKLLASTHPQVDAYDKKYLADGMKCLNILGILWSGRGQPAKAVCFLLTANQLFHHNNTTGTVDEAVNNAITHNLFYLAQAYGHLQDSFHSSSYCQQTLQRQLTTGLADIHATLEWIKNCVGIADYYLALQQYGSAGCILASAEKVLKENVIKVLYERMDLELAKPTDSTLPPMPPTDKKPNFVSGNLNAAEIEADLHRRWASMDVRILKRAVEHKSQLAMAEEMGIDLSKLEEDDNTDQNRLAALPKVDDKVCFFSNLPIAVPTLVNSKDIVTFDNARLVFLRAASRIENAKKYFVLDGYVTDHVGLLQDYSKLYHMLASFEPDIKRRTAMETRRLDMLLPLLTSLSKTSYDVLHKQLSYELGENVLVLMELKLDKLRLTSPELSEMSFKKSELEKYNEHCRMGLALFAHFIHMYAQNKDRGADRGYPHLITLPLHTLASDFLADVDEGKARCCCADVSPDYMSQVRSARRRSGRS